MSRLIIIPHLTHETRLGRVYSTWFDVINETECSGEPIVWDFGNSQSLPPLLVGALALYIHKAGVPIGIRLSQDKSQQRYFDLIHFRTPVDIQTNPTFQKRILSYKDRLFTPVCRFDVSSQTETIQTLYKNVISCQSEFNHELSTPVSYLLSELMDNMVEHSLAQSGYIFSQYSENDHCLNICLADEGISILGSFMLKRKDIVAKHDNNEGEILKLSTRGLSTKELPYGQLRGFGLSTSKKMLVEGLGGDFAILSGNAFHLHRPGVEHFINLPAEVAFHGTLLFLRIPMVKPLGFNYINYIQ